MAEVVNERIEEMLPELEQMERVKLFKKREIRQITSRRKIYEYKLKRRQKVKEDFLQYIQYEINLLALVKKRREGTGYTFKKLEIDHAIVQRIHKLFKMCLSRFPEDIKLWLTYIAFARKRRENAVVSKQYSKMLQVHNKKPELWVAAAKWEFEHNNNPDTARSLIQRGLRFNEQSRTLWLEYYRLELMYAEKMLRRKELLGDTLEDEDEVSDAVLQGQVAKVVYANAIETIPEDVNFLLSFLPICQLFEFTRDQEETICQELREHHSDQPVAWDALARRCLGRQDQLAENDGEDPELMFHKVYEEAVNTVPSDEIWSLYITACLELLAKKSKNSVKKKRLQRVLLVFEEAKDAGCLEANLYLKWIDVLCDTGCPSKALEVSKEAVVANPMVCDLWHKRLSLLVTSNEATDKIQEELKQAQNLLPQKETWPLVQLVLEYTISIDAADTTVRLLESSMIGRSEVSTPAKNLYLEYEYLKHGIDQARKIYNRVQQFKPVCADFYKAYISMELAQSKPKMKIIRSVFEEAVREHGSHEPDLWLDYIKLESSHEHGKPASVGNIHFRAVKALTGTLNQEFIKKYTLLQTSAS
ncbi:U3 small nucleolar RNA-associated protein 6 homolog [Mercenaria mercenaria]|uniref:U3 small nucleolar RNA-associated protein 6 homolog n=1 Tax=Mercenaria mercenaria TaxID=6596 RepID=UPI00234EB159|nr:U3 small nucleolar RNA-associated protein 6 homolog [Mercenaria mercenaria]